MKQRALTDRTLFPTEDVIFSHIGRTKSLWLALFDGLRKDHPDIVGEWRYYNDGKSWLLKMQRKTKTVFWLGVFEGGFRTTFYFGDKAAEAISASRIPPELKKQFTSGPKYGKIRGITVHYRKKQDVDNALRLVDVKLSIK